MQAWTVSLPFPSIICIVLPLDEIALFEELFVNLTNSPSSLGSKLTSKMIWVSYSVILSYANYLIVFRVGKTILNFKMLHCFVFRSKKNILNFLHTTNMWLDIAVRAKRKTLLIKFFGLKGMDF